MNIFKMSQPRIGYLLLRIGMAAVYLFFGYWQLTDGASWAGLVPEWATALSGMSSERIVMFNGGMEALLGALLLFGLWVRVVATILAIHLFVIAYGLGLTPEGVRDAGLAIATLAIALLGKDK